MNEKVSFPGTFFMDCQAVFCFSLGFGQDFPFPMNFLTFAMQILKIKNKNVLCPDTVNGQP